MAYAPRREREVLCPLEYGMKTFGGKWRPRIVCVLNVKGALRYSDLKREPVNVSDTVLSSALRELEVGGIVGRTQYGGIPVRVEYSLTEKGATVVPILQMVCRWSKQTQIFDENRIPVQCRRRDCIKI